MTGEQERVYLEGLIQELEKALTKPDCHRKFITHELLRAKHDLADLRLRTLRGEL